MPHPSGWEALIPNWSSRALRPSTRQASLAVLGAALTLAPFVGATRHQSHRLVVVDAAADRRDSDVDGHRRPLARGPSLVDDPAAAKLWKAAWLLSEAAKQESAARASRREAAATTVSAPAVGRSPVARCVMGAESGNYAEASHPGSGSGAYQFIPSTWRHWSKLAGYPGYAYAYEAPPSVQDAVFDYTVTHGGAHNWDPRFGKDSCTVNMP